jgi:CheY-like chemotaxis protein
VAPFRVIAPALSRASGRILIVEDDFEVARVTTEVFQEIGYQTVEARDGHAALALIEKDPEIELVLSEVVMPGRMSGLELARKLRLLRPELPVVLATGYAQWDARVADEDFVFIAKPYRREALAQALRAAFERRKTQQHVTAPDMGKTARI